MNLNQAIKKYFKEKNCGHFLKGGGQFTAIPVVIIPCQEQIRPKIIIFSWRNSTFKMWNFNRISCNSPSSDTFSRRASFCLLIDILI